MTAKDDLISFLRDVNDITELLTGTSAIGLTRKAAELFGWETVKKVLEKEVPDPDSPYAVLDVRPDASTLIIRAKYKSLIRFMNRDSEEYNKLREAYTKILAMRGEG